MKTWQVLVHQAKQRWDEAQRIHEKAQHKHHKLMQTLQRLQGLQSEYTQRHHLQGMVDHFMADRVNERRFLGQLQVLLERAEREVQEAAQAVQLAQRGVQLAWLDLNKYEKLLARVQQQWQKLQIHSEQKAMDALAVLHYRRID